MLRHIFLSVEMVCSSGLAGDAVQQSNKDGGNHRDVGRAQMPVAAVSTWSIIERSSSRVKGTESKRASCSLLAEIAEGKPRRFSPASTEGALMDIPDNRSSCLQFST